MLNKKVVQAYVKAALKVTGLSPAGVSHSSIRARSVIQTTENAALPTRCAAKGPVHRPGSKRNRPASQRAGIDSKAKRYHSAISECSKANCQVIGLPLFARER